MFLWTSWKIPCGPNAWAAHTVKNLCGPRPTRPTRFRRLWLQDLWGHYWQRVYELSVYTTRWKKLSSDWLQSAKPEIGLQHLSEKMQFPCFLVFPGKPNAEVRGFGKIKHRSIVYVLSNIPAKNHQNQLMYVTYVMIVWTIFETHHTVGQPVTVTVAYTMIMRQRVGAKNTANSIAFVACLNIE